MGAPVSEGGNLRCWRFGGGLSEIEDPPEYKPPSVINSSREKRRKKAVPLGEKLDLSGEFSFSKMLGSNLGGVRKRMQF